MAGNGKSPCFIADTSSIGWLVFYCHVSFLGGNWVVCHPMFSPKELSWPFFSLLIFPLTTTSASASRSNPTCQHKTTSSNLEPSGPNRIMSFFLLVGSLKCDFFVVDTKGPNIFSSVVRLSWFNPSSVGALTLTSGFSSSHLFVVSIWVFCNCWAKTLSNSSCFSSSCCFFFWRSIFLSTSSSFFFGFVSLNRHSSLFLWGTMRNQTIPLSSACWFFVVPHEIAAHFW